MGTKTFINKVTNRIIDILKETYIKMHLTNYYHTSIDWGGVNNINNLNEKEYCELIAFAFNNERVIEFQIRCINQHFKYPYRYTVCDNSTNNDSAQAIHKVCNKYNVGYVRLPKQKFLFSNMGSYSHGIAINFVWRNFLKYNKQKYFGILDHDIFCIEDFHIDKYLEKQPFYGHTLHCKKDWNKKYLWPGFCFFRMDFLKGKEVDFRPSRKLAGDTGARNYPLLFKDIDLDSIEKPKERHMFFGNNKSVEEGGYSFFECGWIHLWNASNYMKLPLANQKLQCAYTLLENELKSATYSK